MIPALQVAILLALPGEARPMLDLRMVHLVEGVTQDAPNKDKSKIKQTQIYQMLDRQGIDLEGPENPWIAHSYQDGTLFYLFYKTMNNTFGDRPYVIQRIRKTERYYSGAGRQPRTKTTYLVEVFKTNGGTLKGYDRHFGKYSLGQNARREIIKHYEIGFGEIPGLCEGKDWPFEDGRLYRQIQAYAPASAIYDRVRFDDVRRWSLNVSFDANQNYQISCPELKFELPARSPPESIGQPWKDRSSQGLVLVEGVGIHRILVGKKLPANIGRVLGKPLEVVDTVAGKSNGVLFHFDALDKVSKIVIVGP